ncbi:hypothetical protein Ddye_013755 [Dipteronia dyeriana]|uniref:Uncharacterized protein n=1 Tax=Dipteronia dyeriana TaxID=168575 RepID=A0AAD9X6V3_9ROSI|nr:hypothetical protein Ddye_013755 [Dipteronia dyeriana]
MDERTGRENNNGGAKKITSACDVEALKKCLEENKGDYVKCQSQIEAFKSSCSLKKPNSVSNSKSFAFEFIELQFCIRICKVTVLVLSCPVLNCQIDVVMLN